MHQTTTTASGSMHDPEEPGFHQRVLDNMPGPLLVVDAAGQIIYSNTALADLVGWTAEQGLGSNIIDFIHPDDLEWVSVAFQNLTRDADMITATGTRTLPSIHLRVLTPHGEAIPLEITGAPSATDNVIGGAIYDARPARYHDLLGHVLAGVAAGADVVDLLTLVTQLIAMPPLRLEAAVLASTDAGWEVLTSTSIDLTDLLSGRDPLPLSQPSTAPVRLDDAAVDPSFLATMRAVCFQDIWHASIAGDHTTSYEIVAVNTVHQRHSSGVLNRLTQAKEVAGVVMVRAEAERLLRQSASSDSLTGLLNRSAFRSRLDVALGDLQSDPIMRPAVALALAPPSLIFLDLDGFKPINDRHGHAVGDVVLEVVAARISAAVRSNDVVGRLGGDEFAVLLCADGRSAAAPHTISSRIVASIAQPIVVDAAGTSVSVTASIGLADLHVEDTVDGVLGRADRLMYDAKRCGGSRLRHEAG